MRYSVLLSNLSFKGHYGGVENSIRFLSTEFVKLGAKVTILSGYYFKEGCSFNRKEVFDDVFYYSFRFKPFKSKVLNILFLPCSFIDVLFTLFLIKKDRGITVSISRNQFVCFFVNIFFSEFNYYLAPGFSYNQSSDKFLYENKSFSRYFKNKINNFLDLRAITKSKGLYVFSQNMKDQATKLLHSNSHVIKRIRICKPGVDKSVFHPLPSNDKLKLREELNIPNDTKIILCVGRFVRAKGFDLAVSSITHTDVDKFLLVFVGDGAELNFCKELSCSLGLANKVVFIGSSSVPSKYYQAADYFLMSSIYEPLGQTILEAISSGLPVIAFDSKNVMTATKELLNNDCCFFVNEISAEALGRTISESLSISKEQYDFMSKSAIGLSDSFSWRGLASTFIDLNEI